MLETLNRLDSNCKMINIFYRFPTKSPGPETLLLLFPRVLPDLLGVPSIFGFYSRFSVSHFLEPLDVYYGNCLEINSWLRLSLYRTCTRVDCVLWVWYVESWLVSWYIVEQFFWKCHWNWGNRDCDGKWHCGRSAMILMNGGKGSKD